MATEKNMEADAVKEIELDADSRTLTYTHGDVGAMRLDNIVDEYAVPGYTMVREDDGRPQVRVRTFGSFSISIDNKPVAFPVRKAAEYLAVLIDAQGVPVDNNHVKKLLYEDDYAKGVADKSIDARFRGLKKKVKDQLRELGIEFILNDTVRGKQFIDASTLRCDLYDYLAYGKNSHVQYYGVYMENFDWSHRTATAARLDGELAK